MKHAKVALVVAACGGFVSACYPIPRMAPIWPQNEAVSNYAIGETMRATPGSVMVDRTDGSQTLPGFVLVQPFQIVGTSQQVPETGGRWAARFEYRGPCPTGNLIVTNPYFYEERVGIVISRDGTIDCEAPVLQLVGGNRGRTWRLAEALPLHAFEQVPFVAGFAPDAVRWQLVYGGRSGNTLNVDYREFRNGAFDDDAVPVYQQQLHFDLGASKTISFRNTEIQIVSATNREVAYRVVKHEGAATRMPHAPAATHVYREERRETRTYDNPPDDDDRMYPGPPDDRLPPDGTRTF